MKFSYNWLKDYVNFKIQPQALAELLALHSFETEVASAHKKDTIFNIDILPNRFADASSHIGVSREIRSILSLLHKKDFPLRFPPVIDFAKQANNLEDFLVIQIKEPELCPRYATALLEDVQVKPSPLWLKQRLSACGMGSVNNIVDITNFVMLEFGQPLHAFDFDKIAPLNKKESAAQGKKGIIIRKAKKREKALLLGDKAYEFDQDDLVISDSEGVLALAGIKGGKRAEINKKTVRVLLEAASFNPQNVFSAAKKAKIESDAARRFAAGLDEELPPKALARAVYLIVKEGYGKLVGFQEQNLWKPLPVKIKLELAKARKVLGFNVTCQEIKKILLALGCEIEKSSSEFILVKAPNFRKDLKIQEDIIEEIARLKGYAKIPPKLPYLPLVPAKPEPEEIYQDKTRETLKGAGFTEVYNYSFVNKKTLSLMSPEKSWALLQNPISERFAVLRPNLLPNLVINLQQNLRYGKELRFFEIGKIFRKVPAPSSWRGKNTKAEGNNLIAEETQLAFVALTKESFFELKGIIELLLKSLGISDFWFEPQDDLTGKTLLSDVFDKQASVSVKINDDTLGHIGRFTRKTLSQLDIQGEASGGYLNFQKVLAYAQKEIEYREPSKYPAVMRDLALLVPKHIKFSQVLNTIEQTGSDLIQDIDLFDVYEGENIPEGKKSLAFHIIYQSSDHTLTNSEVNKVHAKIEKALKKQLGAIIR